MHFVFLLQMLNHKISPICISLYRPILQDFLRHSNVHQDILSPIMIFLLPLPHQDSINKWMKKKSIFKWSHIIQLCVYRTIENLQDSVVFIIISYKYSKLEPKPSWHSRWQAMSHNNRTILEENIILLTAEDMRRWGKILLTTALQSSP